MPNVKVYIHYVWSTKNRQAFLSTHELRKELWQHMRENAKEKGIYIDFIGGFTDHCHCLVSMGIDQTIKDIAQLIKGESSFWMNKQKLCISKFNWQNDYFAASVSESMIDITRNYIKNQEEHHKYKSFKDEYNDFLEKHGFKKFID
jgi:putative transposase